MAFSKRSQLLKENILRLAGPTFAVCDGAQFDDLPRSLLQFNLIHRPLYRNRGTQGKAFDLTAPRIVRLDRFAEIGSKGVDRTAPTDAALAPVSEPVLDRLLNLLADRAAAVFWECLDGEEALYRHLRGVNMVKLPREKVRAFDETEDEDRLRPSGTADAYEAVMFRHADANVMAQILPALDATSFARAVGPAQSVLFSPDPQWSDQAPRPMVARRPNNALPGRSGPLVLDLATVERIEDRRKRAAIRDNRHFVSRHLPPEIQSMREDEIDGFVEEGMASASSYSITEKAAIQRWSYMSVVTRGEINRDEKIRRFMANETFAASPDGKTKQLMDAFIHGLRKRT